jgi:isopenicillin N synthase-like dioxygenase
MEDLALIVLEIFSLALDESPTFFENKMDHHMSALRLVHYYPLLEQQQQQHPSTSTMQKNKSSTRLIRAGAHTDYGALTILATQKEGLEVLLRDNTNTSSDDKNESDDNEIKQRWFPVPLVPGSLIVNLGDLMQRWTNDEWVSTMHRVVMPSTEAHERRYSMAYFVNINGDTPIEPLKCCRGGGGGGGGGGGSGVDDDDSTSKYKVITAGEHLMAKHLASMGIADGKDEDIESAINGEL